MAESLWELLGMGGGVDSPQQPSHSRPPLDRTAVIAQEWLRDFPKNFRLYPLDDQPVPAPNEWSDFLREHPQYTTGQDRIFTEALASDRRISEELDPNYQRLAGTIIRASYSDEQLMSMLPA